MSTEELQYLKVGEQRLLSKYILIAADDSDDHQLHFFIDSFGGRLHCSPVLQHDDFYLSSRFSKLNQIHPSCACEIHCLKKNSVF